MEEKKNPVREGEAAGQHPDMGVKTDQGMDHEGQLKGSHQSAFNESSAQEHQRSDRNPLNKTDDRGTISGTESV